jgi:hypothetical protein
LSAVTGREVRLVFVGRHHVRNLQWMRVDDDDPVTGLTPAGTATHSVAGEVAGMLGGAGKEEVTLSPGERLTLTFRVPPMPEGKVRDYYFASRGVYTTLPSQGGTSAELPKQLELLPARPNPTGGTVRLGFALPTPGRVRLTIFDPMGRMVLRPIDGLKDAGRHELTWDLKDRSGRRVPSGIYFYRMEVGSWKQERRLTVR